MLNIPMKLSQLSKFYNLKVVVILEGRRLHQIAREEVSQVCQADWTNGDPQIFNNAVTLNGRRAK